MTQSIELPPPGLARLQEAAKRDRQLRFNNLMTHVTVELLEKAFHSLNRQAASGVDGLDWKHYAEDLRQRLDQLNVRLHTNRYKPRPVKRIWIPKANGKLRPIGITAIEDKVVQQALVWILEAIYERDFLGFSYGFRSGRSQHQALDAVYMAVTVKKVGWVLDADIQGFFDTIDHTWMMRFLAHRIADPRLLRMIERTLKCGVEENGQRERTVVGTPQGAVISPLLGNIYLHYVLDLWAHRWRRRAARGETYIVRYADDSVVGFQYRADGQRFLRELKTRLGQFGLSLNDDKTRLIEFGRFAQRNCAERGGGKPATFDFLGFTHICSRRRSDGGFLLKRYTIAKRQRDKLGKIKQALRRNRHRHPFEVGRWLRRVVEGYLNYFAVPGNRRALDAFRSEICRTWLRALRRRSQKSKGLPWRKMTRLIRLFIPSVRIRHPYPNQRLRV